MTAAAPRRIQRQRTKGWRAPEGAINVARPGKYGNPFNWTDYPKWQTHVVSEPLDEPVRIPDARRRQWAVTDFETALDPRYGGSGIPGYPSIEQIKAELAGHDLMCWCPLTEPDGQHVRCHADVLLAIANDRTT